MGAITSTSANQIVTRDSSTNESNQTIGMALDSIIKIIKDF
jgi:hypothetical protein